MNKQSTLKPTTPSSKDDALRDYLTSQPIKILRLEALVCHVNASNQREAKEERNTLEESIIALI